MESIDWVATIGAIGGVLVTLLTLIGGGIKVLLVFMDKRDDRQREFVNGLMTRIEGITTGFNSTILSIQSEAKKETRQTINTLLNIQTETVKAVTLLSHEVKSLGSAVGDLRSEIRNEKPKT